VIDMQKTWWRTLAVRRVRHRLFVSASRHFLFSDRWPSSFKKPERLIDQFMMLLDTVGQEPVAELCCARARCSPGSHPWTGTGSV
jgi:hypothetical protein